MIEPMQPDPVEAVRPQSAAEQLAARVAGYALAQSAAHTAYRGLKLEEPRYVCLASATTVAHGRPGALGSADMYDASGALLQIASGRHSGL